MRACLVSLVGIVASLSAFDYAWGFPEFARVFNTKCATCHWPVPPRLNNVGLVFRRMGFRLADVDAKDNLIFKPARLTLNDPETIGSLYFEGAFTGEKHHEPTRGFEAGLLSAHALDDHWSYLLHVTRVWDQGTAPTDQLERLEVQYNWGKPTAMWHLRAGQFQPLLWQKTDQQALTLTGANTLTGNIPIGSFGGFNFSPAQRGVELAHTINRLGEGGELYSTMLSGMLLHGIGPDGDARDSGNSSPHLGGNVDVLLQVLQTFGTNNTVSAFYYNGRARFPGGDDPGDSAMDRFQRFGVVGNYQVHERVDLLGGYVVGKDTDKQELNKPVWDHGFFGETDIVIIEPPKVEQTQGRVVGVLRYDHQQPGNDRAVTVGLRYHARIGKEVRPGRAFNEPILSLEYRWEKMAGAFDKTLTFGFFFIY